MVTIAEKINAVLAQRRMLKRDLARALGVAPQTATDICKGRSAVTLPHLRKLCETFGLRADYWLDESTLEPGPGDRMVPGQQQRLAGLVEAGLLEIEDAGTFARHLIELAREHRAEWVRRFGAPAGDVADVLGVPAEHRRAEAPAQATDSDDQITPMSAQVERAPSAVGRMPGDA
jgi:transcriptional regulator with XRE-family HTH domain